MPRSRCILSTMVMTALPFVSRDTFGPVAPSPAGAGSKVARIRLTSSDRVLRAAEEVGRRLLEAYERPPENPAEVVARYVNGEENMDPLREFTEACRQEQAEALKQV